jgi:eukaryotic-like serine/threonine-protein kinase
MKRCPVQFVKTRRKPCVFITNLECAACMGRIDHEGDEAEVAVVGALVLNRFRLRDRLGSGGFGTVYRAWDERLERDVAVKVIDAGGPASDRVLREAQAAARLNHPGVVTLYELGEDGRHAYLVSELVDGSTLAEISRDGALSDRDVGEVGADLCEALEHAHDRGVVHRDIKPQNVMLPAADPQAKLMDFGIARMLDGAGLTATGDVVGTLAYMAPEQAEGEQAGPAADAYSLALTLYEAWSGENPHARATPAATARAIGTVVPSLSGTRPELPPQLTDAVDACLDPEPACRLSVAELGVAISEVLPALDPDSAAPASRRRRGLPVLARALDEREPGRLAAAAAVGGLSAAAMIAVPASGAGWAYLLPPVSALLALLRPRLGYLAAALGLCAWLAGPAAQPGAALALAALALPPGLLVGPGSRALPLPAAAPALGAVGLAPIYPALAGLAARPRDRLVLGAAGYAWLGAAEAVLGRKLLFGSPVAAPDGWQDSAGAAVSGLLLPLATAPEFLFGIGVFSLGALTLGALVRGRSTALDLLGALIWAAALVAALRLRDGAIAPSPALLALAVLAVVGAALAWRARAAAAPSRRGFGAPAPPLREAGRQATLS